MSPRTILALAVLFHATIGTAVVAQEPITALLTFDEAKIGPRVACDGQFRLRGGGQVALQPWCNDGKDSFEGASYSITTGYDAETAEAAKVRAAYRSSIPRGMILQIDAPPSATLLATTGQGNSMWDALAKGIRIGIIASSDHGQTHQARAGVYVDDLAEIPADLAHPVGFTRGGILEALKARRAFGATTAVAMQVSVGDKVIGEEFTVDDFPVLETALSAAEPIDTVEVIRNNQFVFSTSPGAKEFRFQFQDTNLRPGQTAYYYIRAKIGKEDVAWTSPVWVTRKAR